MDPSPPSGSGDGLPAHCHGPLHRSAAVDARLQQLTDELARVEVQVNDRLDRRGERATRMAERAEARHQALTAQLRDAVARVDALEQGTREMAAELSDLGELQAALDGGLGQLRAQMAGHRRVPAIRPAVAVSPPPARGRRQLSERSADANAQLEAVSAMTDDLRRDQQRGDARLAALERSVGEALAASARASAQAAALANMRREVGALRAELAAHQAALATLGPGPSGAV